MILSLLEHYQIRLAFANFRFRRAMGWNDNFTANPPQLIVANNEYGPRQCNHCRKRFQEGRCDLMNIWRRTLIKRHVACVKTEIRFWTRENEYKEYIIVKNNYFSQIISSFCAGITSILFSATTEISRYMPIAISRRCDTNAITMLVPTRNALLKHLCVWIAAVSIVIIST